MRSGTASMVLPTNPASEPLREPAIAIYENWISNPWKQVAKSIDRQTDRQRAGVAVGFRHYVCCMCDASRDDVLFNQFSTEGGSCSGSSKARHDLRSPLVHTHLSTLTAAPDSSVKAWGKWAYHYTSGDDDLIRWLRQIAAATWSPGCASSPHRSGLLWLAQGGDANPRG